MKPYLAKVTRLPRGYHYPFKTGDIVLVLGEIEQMPGHMVIALPSGQVIHGYHPENFRKLRKSEV